MDKDLQHEIRTLQREILTAEEKIIQLDGSNSKNLKKYIDTIHADLKYLSIIVNSAPIEPRQSMQIREFLRIHLENLWRIPLHA
ncbi:MAG: hypothetical protein R3230_04915 [Nitrosopumilaceae archaeon]|nr:hypothetical protein [Nitrosopumilaceae archaeon]